MDALDDIERARCGFGHGGGFRGAMVLGVDDGDGVIGRGGAHDGADIVRVAHLVEDDERTPWGL